MRLSDNIASIEQLTGARCAREWLSLYANAAEIDPSQQLRALREVLNKDPIATDSKLWGYLSHVESDLGDLNAAIQSRRTALYLSPEEDFQWIALADLLQTSGARYFAEVEACYRQAMTLSHDPGHALAQWARFEGETKGNWEDAASILARVLDHSPTEGWSRISYEVSWSWPAERVVDFYLRYVKTGHRDPSCLQDFHRGLLNCGQLELANEAARDAMALAPDNIVFRLAVAASHAENGDLPASLGLLRDGLSVAADPAQLWAQIASYSRKAARPLQEADGEFFRFRRLASSTPPWHSAWMQFGLWLQSAGNSLDAEHAFRQAVDAEPDNHWSLQKLASHLTWKLGRHSEAEILARRAVALAPDKSGPHTVLAYALGFGLKRWETAKASYRTALTINPKSLHANKFLAIILSWTVGPNQPETNREALLHFEQAIEAGLSDAWTWYQFGVFLAEKQFDFVRAEHAFRRSVEIEPKELGHLGLAKLYHFNLHRYDEARDQYQLAATFGAADSEVRLGLERLKVDRRKGIKLADGIPGTSPADRPKG